MQPVTAEQAATTKSGHRFIGRPTTLHVTAYTNEHANVLSERATVDRATIETIACNDSRSRVSKSVQRDRGA